LRDTADATEVAQDAFVRIYRHVGEFRGECEFTTWLHQIVVNLARNKHRWWHRRGRERTVSLDSAVPTEDGEMERQVRDDAEAPDATVAHREFAARLQREVGLLPRKYREALVLRNVEGLSYEEIAVALRCSVGTVKSRIARGRDALRERLEAEER
jgi:RNA polymerase sigma-70 factor (ECF subfamily)